MAARQSMPKQGKSFAAGAALLMIAAWHAGPAFASSNSPSLCDDVADLAFAVPEKQLQANAVSHEVDAKGAEKSDIVIESVSRSHILAPRVEAALRRVFEDATTPLADSDKATTDEAPVMNTRVPGVSDEELARYKRQMYRTDI